LRLAPIRFNRPSYFYSSLAYFMSKWIFQAGLTVGLVVGGGYIITRNDQPLEVRLPVAAMVGGAVTWWFRSPLEGK
jgi:hypothetical protein